MYQVTKTNKATLWGVQADLYAISELLDIFKDLLEGLSFSLLNDEQRKTYFFSAAMDGLSKQLVVMGDRLDKIDDIELPKAE